MSNVQFKQAVNSKLAPSPKLSEANKTAQNIPNTIQYAQSVPARAIYQYPQTNIYPQSTSNVEDKSGNTVVLNPGENTPVNVYIQNPSGYMGPNYYNQQYHKADQTNPIAASSLEEQKPKKTKRIVELTDDYIKSLENYLRNQNRDIRMQGMKELVKRFEEDKTRYDDPALNALLNIALQDKSSKVRSLALTLADSGVAKGDATTLEILKNLRTSKSNFGIDATTANSALLKMSAVTKEVEDDSTGRNSVVYKL